MHKLADLQAQALKIKPVQTRVHLSDRLWTGIKVKSPGALARTVSGHRLVLHVSLLLVAPHEDQQRAANFWVLQMC